MQDLYLQHLKRYSMKYKTFSSVLGEISRIRPIRLGIPLKYQILDTGAANSICPILSRRTLEKVLYFACYIVLDAGDTDLAYKQVLTEKEYREAYEKYGDTFRVGIPLKYQIWDTGAANSICPIHSRRTLAFVTSTPHRSQTTPL